MPATLRWLGLALLGILIAAGVSIAASRLASQQIGLASQPISAGDALAPAVSRVKPSHRHPGPGHRPANRQAKTSPEPSTIPSMPPTSEPPTYSPPPSTVPTSPATPSPGSGHDGEHSGTAGGGADD
jgi:hypothetical protein